jgi:hypothetical protein
MPAGAVDILVSVLLPRVITGGIAVSVPFLDFSDWRLCASPFFTQWAEDQPERREFFAENPKE